MIDVFTLTGKEMTDEGNFFAAMFVALAGACLFSYYAMGWGTNTLAQVSNALQNLHDKIQLTDQTILGFGTQPAKTNLQRHSPPGYRVL